MNFNKFTQDREKGLNMLTEQMPEDFDVANLSKIKNFGGSSIVYELSEGYVVKEKFSVTAKKFVGAREINKKLIIKISQAELVINPK